MGRFPAWRSCHGVRLCRDICPPWAGPQHQAPSPCSEAEASPPGPGKSRRTCRCETQRGTEGPVVAPTAGSSPPGGAARGPAVPGGALESPRCWQPVPPVRCCRRKRPTHVTRAAASRCLDRRHLAARAGLGAARPSPQPCPPIPGRKRQAAAHAPWGARGEGEPLSPHQRPTGPAGTLAHTHADPGGPRIPAARPAGVGARRGMRPRPCAGKATVAGGGGD